MNFETGHRFLAVVMTDLRLRLRRTSTLVVFLLLSALPYLWVPDPATGRAVFVLDQHRVIYDSTALALATGMLCSMLLGLFGYYLVSQSLAQDIRTRCGYIIAATPVSRWEYILAKVAGNVAFLSTLTVGFMACAMAMQLVRGEAPLEPATFALYYLLLLLPTVVFVSSVAALFESVHWLAGKLGDVLFFFGWLIGSGLTTVLATTDSARPGLALTAFLDVSGLGFVMQQTRLRTGSDQFSIGASAFDPNLEALALPALLAGMDQVLIRLAALLPALPVLILAVLAFHRFDPARVRHVAARRGRGYLERLEALVAPLTRPLLWPALAGVGRGPGLSGAVVSEAALILLLQPLGAFALVAVPVLALALPAPLVASVVLPIAMAALGLVLAGSSGREALHGTAPLVAAAPALDRHHVGWKLAAALSVGLGATLVPALRIAAESPQRGASVVVGTVFVAGMATALGIFGGSPKAFLALFLSFLYLVLNDSSKTPALDFAGFSGTAGPRVWIGYLLATAVALALAFAIDRHRRSR